MSIVSGDVRCGGTFGVVGREGGLYIRARGIFGGEGRLRGALWGGRGVICGVVCVESRASYASPIPLPTKRCTSISMSIL